jgi:hypothetical protein
MIDNKRHADTVAAQPDASVSQAPGKVQMKPVVQEAPGAAAPGGASASAPGGRGAASAAPAAAPAAVGSNGAGGDPLVDQMVAAMGLPPLPRGNLRPRALRKMGMTEQSARQRAEEMFGVAPGAEGAAGAATAEGGETAAPAQGKLVQAHGSEVGVRDVNIDNGGGRPINPEIAQAMGPMLGGDVSNVMLHQDGQAEAMGAHAFAVGNHLHFAQGKLDTSSESGLALLGHELTHVVQQSNNRVSAPSQAKSDGNAVNVQDPALEHEADLVGARAAAAVSSSISGLSPYGDGANAGSAGPAAQMKPSGDLTSAGGITTVQAKPVVQCEGPAAATIAAVELFKIAGAAVTVGEAATAAATVVSAGAALQQQAAATQATYNGTGPSLHLPSAEGSTASLFYVAESGKDIVAAYIRIKTAKALKVTADQAAAKETGDEAAKKAAAKEAVEAEEANATANATTEVKNVMTTKGRRSASPREFVWDDQNGEAKDPTWGSITLRATGGMAGEADMGIAGNDWTDFNITRPAGAISGVRYLRSVEMSARCGDNTVEWWDYLIVTPTKLEGRDGDAGDLTVHGEAKFTWEDSQTTMTWDPAVTAGSTPRISAPERGDSVPND